MERSCRFCGCREPFAGMTDECCWKQVGRHCVFGTAPAQPLMSSHGRQPHLAPSAEPHAGPGNSPAATGRAEGQRSSGDTRGPLPAPATPGPVRGARASRPGEWRSCKFCGCWEPFADMTDECCWTQTGRHCVFEPAPAPPPTASHGQQPHSTTSAGPYPRQTEGRAAAQPSDDTRAVGGPTWRSIRQKLEARHPGCDLDSILNPGDGQAKYPSPRAEATSGGAGVGAPQQRQAARFTEPQQLEVLAVAEEGEEHLLYRPCVDCGRHTGRFCDYCLAATRLPDERWVPGQPTPLCSKCDNEWDCCHFCRGLTWATPPASGSPTLPFER